jgi:hypothetical protein
MSESIVKVICAADGRTPTPHDGRYVVAWDWNVPAGVLAIDSTDDRQKAKRFGPEVFKEWRAISKVQPRRPWDDEPNRPLTAVTVELLRAPE